MKINPRFKAIVIGCSAGGVDALVKLFSQIPTDCKLPIVVVIHIIHNSQSFFEACFGPRTKLKVKEADEKESLLPGIIYFAPPDHHLLVELDKTLSLSREEAVNYSRPSIDVLFKSAADCFGSELLAIVLTGSNNDGAQGAKAVFERGGTVLVEDPATAAFPTMPQAVISTGIPVIIKNIDEISKFVAELR